MARASTKPSTTPAKRGRSTPRGPKRVTLSSTGHAIVFENPPETLKSKIVQSSGYMSKLAETLVSPTNIGRWARVVFPSGQSVKTKKHAEQRRVQIYRRLGQVQPSFKFTSSVVHARNGTWAVFVKCSGLRELGSAG